MSCIGSRSARILTVSRTSPNPATSALATTACTGECAGCRQMMAGSQLSSPMERDWTARVELQDRATRTYVGWRYSRAGSAMYERAMGGTWHRSSGQAPADTELNEVLEFF